MSDTPGTPENLLPPAAEDPAAPAARRSVGWPNAHTEVIDPTEGARRALIIGRCIVGVVTVGLLGLMGRVAQLQTRPPEPIISLKDTQQSQEVILGRRGSILDRHGRVLAGSRVGRTLFVDPKLIEEHNTFAEKVGFQFGIDPAQVEQRIYSRADKRYVVLDKQLSDDQLDKLAAMRAAAKDDKKPGLGLKGLGTTPFVDREYPQGTLAGAVLGYVGADSRGLEGIEKAYDQELRGEPGALGYLRDAQRRSLFLQSEKYREPIDGVSVRLSLDLVVQSIAEGELQAACKEFGAPSGELIVLNPHTGEILAMANYPAVDPNDYGNTPPDKRRNRCVTDTYEPGSTFKPFVWAQALEAGVFRRNEWFNTGDGGWRMASGRYLRDSHGNGRVTGDVGLMKSSNIFMGFLGERLGNQRLRAGVAEFGFGERSGSKLPGEVGGTLHPLKNWSSYTITSIPMGQEVTVTPLQMARAFSVFCNGGLLPTPTILARDSKDAAPPVLERVLKRETADTTREVLRKAVTEGTGKKANSTMYEVFGKTGTAQVAKNGRYVPDAYVGSFVCGAPAEKPRIVVVCVVHLPEKRKGYYGGVIAAPAARRVVEQTLVYLGVPASVPEAPAVRHRVAQR